jgi:Uma2 family endonuclease
MGFFGDRKVELINGDLYPLPVHPPHDTAVYLTFRVLEVVFGVGYFGRPQMTLDLGRRYQPLPDVLVVAGSPRDYAAKHPTTGVLLVEIADSSLRRDRTIKAHRYAHAGIADYWIVNLVDRQLEIYRNPQPDPARRGRFRYADVTIVSATGQAAPLAKPQAMIAVADLLP